MLQGAGPAHGKGSWAWLGSNFNSMAFWESFKTDRYEAKVALKEVEQRVADTKCSMMAVFFEYQGLVSILVIGILYIFKQRHLVI